MKTKFLIYCLALFLPGCGNQVEDQSQSTNYYNLDSLVQNQIKELVMLNPAIRKNAILDNKKETTTIYLDSLGWENELKVFRDANIDKPAFYGIYTIQSGLKDLYSNLNFDEYEQTDEEGLLPVKSLKVYYLGNLESIKKVEIILTNKNELFDSERALRMNFEDRNGIPILSEYYVEGNQKLILNDEVIYEMKGDLIFKD